MTQIFLHDKAVSLGKNYKTGDLLNDVDNNFNDSYKSSLLIFKQTSNVNVSNSIVKTNLLNGIGLPQFSANSISQNDTFRIKASGFISNTSTPILTIDITIGGIVVASSTVTMPLISANCHFDAIFDLRVVSIGTSGTIIGQGLFNIKDQALASGEVNFPLVMTSTAFINTTLNNIISLNATWGNASSSNTITCTNATIEKMEGAGWLDTYTYDSFVNLITNGNFVNTNGWTLPSGSAVLNNYFTISGTTSLTNKFLYTTSLFTSNASRRYAICFQLKTGNIGTGYKFQLFINNGAGAYSTEQINVTPASNSTTNYVIILNANASMPTGTNQRLYFDFDGTYGVGSGLAYDISLTNLEVLDLGYDGNNLYNTLVSDLNKYYLAFGYFEGTYKLQKTKKADFATTASSSDSSLKITGITTLKPFFGKKLVTIGDSNTANNVYQPFVANFTGLVYDVVETQSGKNGHYPMGLGGTNLGPLTNASGVSIYTRSKDAIYYSPNVIIIYCSGNDGVLTGSISDDPYLGNEVALGGSFPCSTYAAYKGMIENLMSSLPSCLIVICGILVDRIDVNNDYNMTAILNWQNTYRLPWYTLAKDVANYYNLPFVDAWHDSGINSRNATPYFYNPNNFGSPTGLVRNVHFNQLGGERLANCICQKVFN